MLRILQKIMQQGAVTEDYFMSAVPARFRGQVELNDQRCRDCRKCIDICPTQAIRLKKNKLSVDHDACIYCGACVDFCNKNGLRHSLHYENAHLKGQLAESDGNQLAAKIRSVLGRSLAIRHVDVGSCNACDFEMSALLNPVYDISQYGIDFVASPRHADLLMVTGVVTRNSRKALEMTLEATPTPRLVMADRQRGDEGSQRRPDQRALGQVQVPRPAVLKRQGAGAGLGRRLMAAGAAQNRIAVLDAHDPNASGRPLQIQNRKRHRRPDVRISHLERRAAAFAHGRPVVFRTLRV